jgi:hypothetical protein
VASFNGKGFLHPTLIKPTINDTISSPESISYEIKDWRGQILKGSPDSETQFRKLNTEERFKLSKDLPKKPTELKENPYSEEYKISGDYDFILKLFNQSNIKAKFINSFFCIMRSGGDSTNFKNLFIKFKEDVLIAKKFYKNYYLSILLKIIRKILQINSFQMNIKNSNYLKKLNII